MKPVFGLPLLLVLFQLSSGAASAQMLSSALAKKVDAVFSDYSSRAMPGCALGVYRGGRLIYAKGYGSADLEHGVPIGSGTVFDIGSTSKQFTAASLVLLQEDGKLSLDDDIRKYLPEMPDYGHTITIRHLLNHTSGLRDYLGLMAMAGHDMDDVTTTADALRLVVRQKGLVSDPGVKFAYCNTGYFLASVIVERVSGKSLREFAAERIFTPLGMTHTVYVNDHTMIVPNRAMGYESSGPGTFIRNMSNWEQNGDGGVNTTVEDLLKWDENFYTPKVGGRALLAELGRRGILNGGDTLDYGEGLLFSDFHGIPKVEHGGAWAGYRAQLLRIPSEHLSVAVLANSSEIDADGLAEKVMEVLMADKLSKGAVARAAGDASGSGSVPTRAAVKFDSTRFAAYAGQYEMTEIPGFVMTFSRESGHYYVQATGQSRSEMFPSSDSTFFTTDVDALVTFHRDAGGGVSAITFDQDGPHPGKRIEPWTIPAEELASYAGRYYSPELETEYTLSVKEGKLVAANARVDTVTFTPPVTKSVMMFQGDHAYLARVSFEKGKDGVVAAMLATLGRSRNIRFERVK